MGLYPDPAAEADLSLGNRLRSQVADQSLQSPAIAINAKTADLANRYRCNVGVMAKGFPPVDVAEMNFNRRQRHPCDRIPQRHAGVGIGAGINQKALESAHSTVNLINQDPFVIGLDDLNANLKRICLYL